MARDPLTTEELLAQLEADERADRLTEQIKATPIDYARTRGIRPQKVYASLRSGKLEWSTCECGRRVIVIAEADELYGLRENGRPGTGELREVVES
jgi:hypothetical protein